MNIRLLCVLVVFFSAFAAHADFSEWVNLSTAKKDVWLSVRTATWKFDTTHFTKGKVRVGLHVMIGNATKKPIEVGPGSFVIRLDKNDKSLFFTVFDHGVLGDRERQGLMTAPSTLAPSDSLFVYMTFVLPDTGMNVELKLTPMNSKKSTWLTFLPVVTTPCKRLALSAEQFLVATDVFQKFMDNGKPSYYDESRRLLLSYLKKKTLGPCTDSRASDLADMSGAALRLVNLEDQQLNNIRRGDRDAVAPMSFFLSMARLPALKIQKEDSKK